MKTRSKSYRIVRRAGQQGTRPSGRDQPEIEKSATESTSSPNTSPNGHQNGSSPNPGPSGLPSKTNQKEKRKKWTREEYKEVLYCFYYALEKPLINNTEDTFLIWCRRNIDSDKLDNLDANKLANTRRYIMRSKKITDMEIEQIKTQVRTDTRDPEEAEVGELDEDTLENERLVEDDNNERERDLDNENDRQIRDGNVEGIPHGDDFDPEELSSMKADILEVLSIVIHTGIGDREPLLKIRQTHKYRNLFILGNEALSQLCTERNPDLTELNQLIYSTSKVLQEKCGIRNRRKRSKTKRQIPPKPKWKKRIEKEIENFRKEISILEELQKSTIKSRKARQVIRKYRVENKDQIPAIKEELKQKLQVKAQRLRRFTKRNDFYRQNKIFETDSKRFYREIGKTTIEVEEIPTEEHIRDFWNSIWGNDKEHHDNAKWIKQLEREAVDIPEQQWNNITTEEVTKALRKSHKWKSPGLDQVPNFWLDALQSAHSKLASSFNAVINDPHLTPSWFCQGTTYLLAKTLETGDPKNYRPITCLSTSYKLLTSILSERTYTHMEENNIFPIEQKGCKKGSYGCKDQLLINKMLLENAKTKHHNLSTAWIDYKKAFDSVPHSWILRCLELFKLSPNLINFLKTSMGMWETNLFLSHSNGILSSPGMKIKCGIFQGDSLSPLLFCMALMPLSKLLYQTEYGYEIFERRINHLFYMDDLKLYASNDDELEGLLKTVKAFSDDIGMEFGLSKCAKATFKRGKLVRTKNIVLDDDSVIKELDQEGTYKYLGVNEGDGIQHAKMKEKIRKECIRRVRSILKTELNSKNRITAINTLALPVVTYSFNIINWNLSELKRLDSKIRKQLTCNRMLHPKSDVDRLYLPRNIGGRGMIQLELSYKTSTIGLSSYLNNTPDWMLQIVCRYENSKKLHSVTKESAKFSRELQLEVVNDNLLSPTEIACKTKKKAKNEGLKQLESRWQEKPLHGQFAARANNSDVDTEATHQWLRSSGLKAETEGFILAAQDQSLFTRNYQANILHNGADPKCRFCEERIETIDHLVSGCSILTPGEYKNRHDRVGQYLHWKICNHFSIKTQSNWYEHHPDAVTEGKNVTILWDFSIQTDRAIQANRPDIVIKDRKNKECLLIDMSVPSDRNVSAKTFEKISKYKDLEIEVEKMWHLKSRTIPVVIGALGLIKKGAKDYVRLIPGNPSLQEIQKIVLNSTAHVLRRALSV